MMRRFRDLFAVADLEQVPADGKVQWDPQNPASERWLISVGLTAFVMAMLLLSTGNFTGGFLELNRLTTAVPAIFWENATGFGKPLILFGVFTFVARRHPQLLWSLFLAAIVGALLSDGLKTLIDTPRPAGLLQPDQFRLIGPVYAYYAAPSGHSLTIFAFTGICLYGVKQNSTRVLLTLFAVLVAISRVAVGAHWLFDILLGAAVGSFTAWVGMKLSMFWPYGLKRTVHYLLIGLLLVNAVVLIYHGSVYQGGALLARMIGCAALTVIIYQYALFPVLRKHNRS